VVVKPLKGKKVEHLGITIEFIGHIEVIGDKTRTTDFQYLKNELQSPGIITEEKIYPFAFAKVDKEYETYQGVGCYVRYFLRVTITKAKIVKEQDFGVMIVQPEPQPLSKVKMDIGIDENLHIEFEFNKGKFALKDLLEGNVNFILTKLKLKRMDLEIVKKEIISGKSEGESMGKYEIMDGCPVRGEIVPIRMYIKNSKLTPTYENVKDRFSVKYYIILNLYDEEERKYFKQNEIVFWRNKI